MPVNIVTRASWGATLATAFKILCSPIEVLLVTYSGTDPCHGLEQCQPLLRDLQQKQMVELEETDIQWNFLISSDGVIFEGRGWHHMPTLQPQHAALDPRTLTVAYICRNKDDITPRMIDSLENFLRDALTEDMIKPYFEYVEEAGSPTVQAITS